MPSPLRVNVSYSLQLQILVQVLGEKYSPSTLLEHTWNQVSLLAKTIVSQLQEQSAAVAYHNNKVGINAWWI